MSNPKKMKFAENVDKTEAKGEHKFYLKFTKDYIKNKKILNVGSWTGPYEILAIELTKKITSTDVEEKALKVLKMNIPQVDCVKAPSHKLPFPDASFDVVTFWDVIEHIPEGFELTSIMEIRRVLKKNGYFFLATPHANFRSKLFDPAYFLAGHRHYSDSSLRSMMEESKFKTEKITHVGSYFSSFYALSFYFFKHILRMKLPNIKSVEDKMASDIASPGYIQVAIRARAI